MLVNYAMPVRDIAVLFRPQVWGYFLSVDRGLAFQWWFHAIGVWLALFLLLKVLTRGDLLVSCSGATALLFSPFFQYWSLNCAPTIIFSIGTLLSARTLWKANTLRYLAVATLALAWFTTAFLLTLREHLRGSRFFSVFPSHYIGGRDRLVENTPTAGRRDDRPHYISSMPHGLEPVRIPGDAGMFHRHEPRATGSNSLGIGRRGHTIAGCLRRSA
jgi:hypothetical protein